MNKKYYANAWNKQEEEGLNGGMRELERKKGVEFKWERDR